MVCAVCPRYQQVQRGGVVGAHKDPEDKGGQVITTTVVQGQNEVRVGGVRFRVLPGDVYGIAGED